MNNIKNIVAAVFAIVCLNSCDLTRLPEAPHGQPIALFSSLMISWTLGMVISIIVFSLGKWKKKMMNQKSSLLSNGST